MEDNNTPQFELCLCELGLATQPWEGHNYCESCVRDYVAFEALACELNKRVRIAVIKWLLKENEGGGGESLNEAVSSTVITWFKEKARQGYHHWQVFQADKYVNEKVLQQIWDGLILPDEDQGDEQMQMAA